MTVLHSKSSLGCPECWAKLMGWQVCCVVEVRLGPTAALVSFRSFDVRLPLVTRLPIAYMSLTKREGLRQVQKMKLTENKHTEPKLFFHATSRRMEPRY